MSKPSRKVATSGGMRLKFLRQIFDESFFVVLTNLNPKGLIQHLCFHSLVPTDGIITQIGASAIAFTGWVYNQPVFGRINQAGQLSLINLLSASRTGSLGYMLLPLFAFCLHTLNCRRLLADCRSLTTD